MIIDSISAISVKRPIMPKTRWKLKTITTQFYHPRCFIRIFSPPEGFCIGVLAFVTSLKEVPSMASQLEDSLRSSWAPGAVLRLLVIPPSSADKEDLTDPDLSSIYLTSTLYLMRSNHRAILHRIHPFTGAVLNVLQKNSEMAFFSSPLQVLEASS